MNKYFALIVLNLFLVACAPYPPPSTGGYAANYIFSPAYQKDLMNAPYARSLSIKLAILVQKTQAMRHSHARKCYPSRFFLLEGLADQIAQEIASGLFFGAETDLRLYELNLYELRKLNTFKGCPRPRKSRSWEALEVRDR